MIDIYCKIYYYNTMKTQRIKSITKISQKKKVYQVTVEKNQNYLTTHDILAHNCNTFQPALRGFIEEFSENCRFVMTCNFKNRIIDAIHSRTSIIEYDVDKKTLANSSSEFYKRLQKILENENVTYDEKVIAELIMKFAPDWRSVINECQRYSNNSEKKISSDVLTTLNDDTMKTLFSYLKEKDFKNMKKWVNQNFDIDPSALFRKIYDSLYTYSQPKSIPQAILIIADYQYKNAFVVDKEINLVAMFTELMLEVEWK